MTQNQKVNTFYNHYAQDRSTKFGDRLVKATSGRIFEFARITRGCSVLEIGPGRGAFADICLEKNIEYWAIEPNEKMADALEKRGVTVLRETVPPVPNLQRTFDVVVMVHVMEHMDTMSAALQVAKEIYGILSANGKFVISSPDYLNWRHHFYPGDFSHNYVTSWRRLNGLLISAGFEDIEGMYLSGPVRGLMCFLISGFVSLLPLDAISAMFPGNRLLYKLAKIQGTFLRSVVVLGKKQASPE